MDVSNDVAFQDLFVSHTVDTINSMEYKFDMKLAPFAFYNASLCTNVAWLYVSLCFLLLIRYRESSAAVTNTPYLCL
jgi:hypothetical protein